MIFIDTNYFLRFLLADIESQYREAKKLFLIGSEGGKKLFTSTIVVFELYWVFTSFYEKDKKETARILEQILSMHFIKLEERENLVKAVSLYKDTTLDLEDAYNINYAQKEGAKEIMTFDRKLQKIFQSTKKYAGN